MADTRTISVRIELEVPAGSDKETREIGRDLAEVARKTLERQPRVLRIWHAASVVRKP